MTEVRDAIILAGGIGTRMLPASLFTPKEALPLADTPAINRRPGGGKQGWRESISYFPIERGNYCMTI